ncbi:replicative DNA helicase [Microcoleus sp. FACHB-672]|uniref:replicative DNA helicase n=1 Tax=Microcoleus sp. FACHB-672 TaxID=2692825 RepID=UPI0016874E6F|nr:replicative DNA helicase [Microcoleus sp. FACHB-672]MBD2043007.1 replicative DNA helicase [Microcoleus sp. FACHB-672]
MINEVNSQSFNDSYASRLPPQNIEAEESILGGILLDPDAINRVAELLRPDIFSLLAHQEIYKAALTLHSKGKPTDLLAVHAWLSDHNLLEKIGGQSKLAQLVERTVSAVNIDALAGLVVDKYVRRQLIKTGNEVAQLGFDTATDLAIVLDRAEQKVFNITQSRPQQGLIPVSDTLIHTFQDIETRNQGIALPGLPCGFYDLDAMTGGFQRSDLVIVAGRPSMGKTAVSVSIARNIAAYHKLPVAIFSLEMSKEQLVQRLLASEAQIESNRLRAGRISQNEWEPLSHAIGTLSELPIFIDDTANVTVTEMRSQARRLQAESGGALGLILIDYLQLMEGSTPDNRVQELSKITRSLKGLARELNVPIIALSQLSRGVEARTNKRPMMSDLRESGCLAGDSLVTLADSGVSVPIRELVGKSGFAVLALNEATMKLEKAVVSNAFATGVKPVFQLKTRLGRTIRATGNHKFLMIHGWKRLDELKAGDRLAIPRSLPSSSVSSMSNAEIALLGHLIGDGCTLPRHAIQYTTREEDLANTVVSLAIETFTNRVRPRINKERNWYQVYLPTSDTLTHNVRTPVAKWLDSMGVFGLRSYKKFVPSKIFAQPQEAIALFLRHLWSTDGCINLSKGKQHYPNVYYASSSKQLAGDVQSLLLRVGINARLSLIPQPCKGRDQYHVWVSGKHDLEKFIELIGAVGSYKKQSLMDIASHISVRAANTNRDIIPHDIWRMYATPAMQQISLTVRQMQAELGMAHCGTTLYKQNVSRERAARLAQVVKSDQIDCLANSDIYWDEIVSIEADGETEVYDLTVPDFHNFIANNLVVHNSIEQDADIVIMLYRDEYYNPDTPDRGIAEIIITKHRNGPTGTVKLLFDPQFTRFRNLASPNRP